MVIKVAVGEKNANEKKNPTHVEVHIIHCTKSPKKVEFLITQSLKFWNMLPNTMIWDIPYAAKIQISVSIIILYKCHLS